MCHGRGVSWREYLEGNMRSKERWEEAGLPGTGSFLILFGISPHRRPRPRQSLTKEAKPVKINKAVVLPQSKGLFPFVFWSMWLVVFQRVSLSQGLDPGFRACKSIPDMHSPRDCQKELESLWVGKRHLSWWQALILLNAMSMWPHTNESHIWQRKGIIPPRKTLLTTPCESEEVRLIWIPFVESLYENYEIWLSRLAEIKIQTNKNIFKTNSEGKNNSTKGLMLPPRSLLATSSFLKLHSLEHQRWVG